MAESVATIGVLSRGDPEWPDPPPAKGHRLYRIFEEIEKLGVTAEAVVFSEEVLAETRARLLALDGVLVWVDPIVDGRDRGVLDQLLRDVAEQGVMVSTHPDVILKMGTKEVLVQTRDMEWGTDSRLYKTTREMSDQLPSLLQAGERVLKQMRGNGGNGVWKVRALSGDAPTLGSEVEVLHALRGARLERMRLGEFVERCAGYFANGGGVVDQPYETRLGDGMVRCYVAVDHVAGFGHQFVTALLPPPEGSDVSAAPPHRLYYGPGKAEFQGLRESMESKWIAEMQRVLDIETEALPVIWDADFLIGPKTEAGEDTYVLCEINVSSVFPIPDEATAVLAKAAMDRVMAAKKTRRD